MIYRVEISRRAAEAVTGLDKPLRRRILTAIESLSGNPRPDGCKKLARPGDMAHPRRRLPGRLRDS